MTYMDEISDGDPRRNARLVGRRLEGGPESWDAETQEVLRAMAKVAAAIPPPSAPAPEPPEPTTITNKPRVLGDEEIDNFNIIREAEGIGLMDCDFDGEKTSVIILTTRDAGDFTNVKVVPLAIMLTPSMFSRITPPEGFIE